MFDFPLPPWPSRPEHLVEPPPPEKPSPEAPKGSRKRYEQRIKYFEEDRSPAPKLRHWSFWMIHNCLSHPLLGFFPNEKTVELHQMTSAWLNHEGYGSGRTPSVRVPDIRNPALWVLHNCVSHVAIGVAPSKLTFELHDWTAELMNIPGWV